MKKINKEKRNQKNRERYANDPEFRKKMKEASLRWKNKNLSKHHIYAAEYIRKSRAKDPNKYNEYCKRWRLANLEKFREHQKRYQMKREFPIRQAIIKYQGDFCAICKKKKLCMPVDHCHTTNQIRGILCPSCNMGLGMFKDNIVFLKTAIKYLGKKKTFGEYWDKSKQIKEIPLEC